MKKFFAFISIFILMLLSACRNETEAGYTYPDDVEYVYVLESDDNECESEKDDNPAPEPEPELITADDEAEAWVIHYETIIPVSAGISITLTLVSDEQISFTSSAPVRNFRFLRVDGSYLEFIVEEDLLVLDELPADTPLFVDWQPTGSMAYAGFALEDEDGITRYFAFNDCLAGDSAFRWREFFGGWIFLEDGVLAPATLRVEVIPQGVDTGAFLRGLGFPHYNAHSDQWGTERIALITDMPVWSVDITWFYPYYIASFSDGWYFERKYRYWPSEWQFLQRITPLQPLVISWQPEANISESGLRGITFRDNSGDRAFALQQENGITYAAALNSLPLHDPMGATQHIQITRRPISEAIELIAVLMIDNQDFLQQFDSYTYFENPIITADIWAAFTSTVDLREFQFFSLGIACDPWIGEAWIPFYVGRPIHGHQDVLPANVPVVVRWQPVGTWPHFGISFLDENGERLHFTLNDNTASGFPPMLITEFTDRVYCCDECNELFSLN